MKIKSVLMVLLISLVLTACSNKNDETVESVTTEEETVEIIEEVVTTGDETSEEVEENKGFEKPETAYGEDNGFVYSTETSFNIPWAFSFANESMTAPQDYPGLSVDKYDAITEFTNVQYKDEGDLRTVDVVIENTCSYDLIHQFNDNEGQFWYVYSFTPIHPGDIYTGVLYASENTSDEKNYYDLTTTIEVGNQKVDVQVKKVEDNEYFKENWMLLDEFSEYKECRAVKRYCYQFTYPKDYDGVVFCMVKNGPEDIFWEYHDEVQSEAQQILGHYTADELIFVRLEDLINSIGVESAELMTIEGKQEEIRLREEEKERAAAEAEAKAQAEAEARAAELINELDGQTIGEWMQENGIEIIDGSQLQ